jgi:hypothetical protein
MRRVSPGEQASITPGDVAGDPSVLPAGAPKYTGAFIMKTAPLPFRLGFRATLALMILASLLTVLPSHAAPRSEMVTPGYKACPQNKVAKAAAKPADAPVASTRIHADAVKTTVAAVQCPAKAGA